MGNAGSKVCETERFERHQYVGDTVRATSSLKRPRSPTSKQYSEEDGQPDRKRSKNQQSDYRIEIVRRDLERRFQALRSDPRQSAVAQPSVATVNDKGKDSTPRTQLEHQSCMPSSPAISGHDEAAGHSIGVEFGNPAQEWLSASHCGSEQSLTFQTPTIGPNNVDPEIPESRPSSPELLVDHPDEADGLGWSVRHANTDNVNLASTLLLTNKFPNYAAAFRTADNKNFSGAGVTDKQRDENIRAIRLANMILRESELEFEFLSDVLSHKTTRSSRGSDAIAPLQLPNFTKVRNAFDEGRISLRSGDQTEISRGKQRPVGGVWARDGWQNLNGRTMTTGMSMSVNKIADRKAEWEPLRARRGQRVG